MGARNVMWAYQRYASQVPSTSLVVLVYMAVVSKDGDEWPWFGLGQAAIAENALGRPDATEADLRAVQRAMTPLLKVGAVTVDRAGAARTDGNTTARYRLNLSPEADAARDKWLATPDGKRRVSSLQTPDGKRRDSQQAAQAVDPTKSGVETRRFLTEDPTESDGTPDENRRPKDEEEPRGAREEGNGDLPTDVTGPRVAEPRDGKIILFPASSSETPARTPRPSRARDLGRAELTAKAQAAQAGVAAILARRQTRQEMS